YVPVNTSLPAKPGEPAPNSPAPLDSKEVPAPLPTANEVKALAPVDPLPAKPKPFLDPSKPSILGTPPSFDPTKPPAFDASKPAAPVAAPVFVKPPVPDPGKVAMPPSSAPTIKNPEPETKAPAKDFYWTMQVDSIGPRTSLTAKAKNNDVVLN